MTSNLLQHLRTVSRNLSSALVLTAVFGIGASLGGVAPAQAGRRDEKDDTTYTIKRVFKAGDADKYRISLKMNVDVQGNAVDMVEAMVMKETTREAKDDGSYATVSEFESASVTVNGMDVDISAMMPKFIVTRDKDGKTDVTLEGGSEQFTGKMGDQIKQITKGATAFVPKKAVKIGDSWDLDATDFGAPGQNVKGKSTLVSVDTIKGRKVGKIKSVMDITGDMGMKMHSETISLIDIATGKGVSMSSKSDGEVGGGTLSMNMNMKMLGPDEKADAKDAIKTDSDVKKP